MSPELFRDLVAQAILAPSVHNVQPARWRLDGEAVHLFEDTRVRLACADPTGHDAAISLGAAFEGFALAAADIGLHAEALPMDATPDTLRHVARISLRDGAAPDPLSKTVVARQSWRGAFAPPTDQDRDTATALVTDDCAVVTDPAAIARIATVVDDASFGFLAQRGFRDELVSWMRLWSRHPRWSRDGLNAPSMNLGLVEKIGAGIVMGPGFGVLNGVGLAKPLLAEAGKTQSAAGIVLFHRAVDEDPFDSGRAFYRAWLRIDAAGFGAAVLAALADDADAAAEMIALAGVTSERRLVSALRVGARPDHTPVARARLSVDDVLI
ncbi:MAG: hypothetical protein AAF214_01470 [Pseudomonadota bacterium]